MRNVFIFCFIALFASTVFAQDIETQPRLYDLGKGYSAQILQPEFKTVTETLSIQGPLPELIVRPAKYKWVKTTELKDYVDGGYTIEDSFTEIIKTPDTYMDIIETIVTHPEYDTFDIVPAISKPNGNLLTPAQITRRIVPAATIQKKRRVIKTRGKDIENVVQVKPRKGFTFIMTAPASVWESDEPTSSTRDEIHIVEKSPVRIRVVNEEDMLVGEFENLDDLNTFLEANGLSE